MFPNNFQHDFTTSKTFIRKLYIILLLPKTSSLSVNLNNIVDFADVIFMNLIWKEQRQNKTDVHSSFHKIQITSSIASLQTFIFESFGTYVRLDPVYKQGNVCFWQTFRKVNIYNSRNWYVHGIWKGYVKFYCLGILGSIANMI